MASKRKSKILIRNCQFAFKCDAVWEDLEKKRGTKARFCSQCNKQVYLCENDADLYRNVIKNRCVAIEKVDHMGELLVLSGVVKI